MQSSRVTGLLAILALAACAEAPMTLPAASAGAAAKNAASADGYIVSFKRDAVPAGFATRVAALGGTVTASYGAIGVAVVSGIDAAAAASLSDLGEVQPDVSFQLLDPEPSGEVEAIGADAPVEPASQANPALAFFYPRQWNMRLIGANTAWAAGRLGSPTVKVAILDTGIDPTHPDLAGLVDFANSANFVPGDDALRNFYFPTAQPWTDLHYHGTHVAATVSSNGLAAAGVTSKTTLMAVKVLNVNGSGSSSAILAGIVHAADHGADVINMSLGNRSLPFDMHDKAIKDFFNKVVDKAFKYAHSKGVLVVVAAGNESQDIAVPQTFKPYCGSMHVVCVSAVGPTNSTTVGPWLNQDTFAPYSNFGVGMIDVAAPGGYRTSVTAACSRTSLQVPVCQTGIYVIGISGTSMATPHVSGLAALLIAEKGLGNGAIRSAIYGTALDLGPAGKDAQFGNGRIQVARALGLQ